MSLGEGPERSAAQPHPRARGASGGGTDASGAAVSLAQNGLTNPASEVSYHWAIDNTTIVTVINDPGGTTLEQL